MASLRVALRIVPALALAGCQAYWTKPNATLEQFRGDHTACVHTVGIPMARDGDRDTLFVYEDVYKECLKSRGWQRVQSGASPGRFRGIEDNALVREDWFPEQTPSPSKGN
jgi:hypothetical protein